MKNHKVVLVGCLTALLLCCPPPSRAADQIFTLFQVKMYDNPSFEGEPAVVVEKWVELKVLENGPGWYKVVSPSGREVYVAAAMVTEDAKWVRELKDPNVKFDVCRNDTHFRNASWGMSPSQVKGTEAGSPVHEDESSAGRGLLAYPDTLASLNAKAIYVFAEDRLVRSKYVIEEKHTNNTDYLTDYESLFAGLAGKYGKPAKDETMWKNDLYKKDKQEWGMAVAVGHLLKYAKWETPCTSIVLYLKGDNFKIDLGIEYSSIELAEMERAIARKEEKNKF